jgi:hypothetical protein
LGAWLDLELDLVKTQGINDFAGTALPQYNASAALPDRSTEPTMPNRFYLEKLEDRRLLTAAASVIASGGGVATLPPPITVPPKALFPNRASPPRCFPPA